MADPAFRGFVESTLDALLVFEGCKRGFLPKISRRLQDYEKRALVVSGAVFVFDEEETGIKRWTDGMSWSPSRTLGNFLVYRELDKKAASNKDEDEEQPIVDRATPNGVLTGAASRLMGGLTSKSDPIDDANDLAPALSDSTAFPPGVANRQRSMSEVAGNVHLDRARERALVGSLTSSYRFRSDGLVKKTISLSGLHLIGYYRIEDVTSGRLRTPSSHAELMSLEVSSGFLTPSLFRLPPVVEVGVDGQLRYKGEADAPISPLTRSGSSSGFPTPNPSQSRPTSSDPYATGSSSHFAPLLANRPPSRDYPAAPGSPRRGATQTMRTSNRFDPYSAPRYSPNAAAFTSAAGYPFPSGSGYSSQPSPNRATFSPLAESSIEQRPSTHPTDALSSSAPASGLYYGQGQSQSSTRNDLYEQIPSGRSSFAGASSGNYYQPRQPTPYQPSSEPSTSSAIFAYNPPPSGLAQRRGSEMVSPSLGYQQQQFVAPPRPASQQYHAQEQPLSSGRVDQLSLPVSRSGIAYSQYSPSAESSHSPYATPPSSSQTRNHYPFPPVVPNAQTRVPTPQAGPPPPSDQNWNQVDLSTVSQISSRSAQFGHSHDARLDSTSSLPPQDRQVGYSTYPPSSRPHPSVSTYPSYDSSHQPSGLVIGFANENAQQHPAIHGLGVGLNASTNGADLYRQNPSTSGSNGYDSAASSYANQSHAQVDTAPHGYRSNVGSSASSGSQQHSYASTSMAPNLRYTLASTSDTIRQSEREGWAPNSKPIEELRVGEPGRTNGGGWWSPHDPSHVEAPWSDHTLIKKEYPHG